MSARVPHAGPTGVEVGSLVDAAIGLTQRAAAVSWRGPDAYDGLWWHWPAPLVGGRLRRQAIMQLHVRSPVDIRRLYRRTHPLVPKGLALFGSTGLRTNRLTGDERAMQLAIDALEVLDADHEAGSYAWGYHWDMQTRWSFYPAGSPSIVHTAFAVSALLEAEREVRIAPALIVNKCPEPPAVAPEYRVAVSDAELEHAPRDRLQQLLLGETPPEHDGERGETRARRVRILRVATIGPEVRFPGRTEKAPVELCSTFDSLRDPWIELAEPVEAGEHVSRVKRVRPAHVLPALAVRPRAVCSLIRDRAFGGAQHLLA